MNKAQTLASLALWKAREKKRYREWRRLVKKKASTEPGTKRDLAFKSWEQAHALVKRRQTQLSKFQILHVSDAGARDITASEGAIGYPYLDSRGFATAWIGHLIRQGPIHESDYQQWGTKQHPASKDTMIAYFRQTDLLSYEKAVAAINEKRINNGHPSISQHQFDALVSFCFNIGCGGFTTSTAAKLIVSGASNKDVADAMMKWNKPKEIIGRRKREADAYRQG